MNLLRILGAYVLLLVAVLLASNLALSIFAGNEDHQTLAVMVVLSVGLIAAILLFALQRARTRRGMQVLEATLPVQRRAELRANAAVFACVAGSVLAWIAFRAVLARVADPVSTERLLGVLAALSAGIATLAIIALCGQAAHLRRAQWLFRVAIVMTVALVGIALVPDVLMLAARGAQQLSSSGGAQLRDGWIALPALVAMVCLARNRGKGQ